ncbi:MAG: hypothetical protein ACKOOL_09045 [Novosphingobium sp.]
MKALKLIALFGAALIASPMLAQDGDDGGGSSAEIIVTGSRITRPPAITTLLPYLDKRPVVGLRRPADGVVRHIEIVSDSREAEMRRSEVQSMLFAALDRAKKDGLSLVTGQLEVTEVTRENWKSLFPGLAGADDKVSDDEDEDDSSDDEDDDGNGNGRVEKTFEDDGNNATIRLMVKTRLTGTIADAQHRISAFVKGVPATGRSLISQSGPLALTIVNPEQYRDEIYHRIADASKHAASFYGADYGVTITGLDREIAWAQVSNTEVFLYIPYGFTVAK